MDRTSKPFIKYAKTLFKIILHCVIASTAGLAGFYLMMISTMGPGFTDAWNGKLDMLIRLSMLGAGLVIILTAIIWLVLPLLRLVINKLIPKKSR